MARFTVKKLNNQLQESFVAITGDTGFRDPGIFNIIIKINSKREKPTPQDIESLRSTLTNDGYSYIMRILAPNHC